MGKTLYLDCPSGISGDMFAAALIDLGANEARLRDALDALPIGGYDLVVSRVEKAGLDCCDFDVVLDPAIDNHDHDMAYLHGDQGRAHDHGACHHHVHRSPADVHALIDAGQLAPRARELAHRMVNILSRAEARAHGVPLEEVHFHEVGAVDSIVDIVSAAVLVDDLDVDRAIVPRLVEGTGTVRCQHGVIPVPVPATLNIAIDHALPLSRCEVEGELVTPTGAANVAALDHEFGLPARYRDAACGLGAGKRAYERPSILRAMVIEEIPAPGEESVPAPAAAMAPGAPAAPGAPTVDCAFTGDLVRLECDIDDAGGEVLAYAADLMRAAGAREVHWTPVFAKKGRPAWQLQAIAAPADVARLEEIALTETTTIGIRRWPCSRTVLERTEDEVRTPWGRVRMKVVSLPDGTRRAAPEFEDAAAVARASGVPLQRVMDRARALWEAGREGTVPDAR